MGVEIKNELRAEKNIKTEKTIRKIVISMVCSILAGMVCGVYLAYKKGKEQRDTGEEKHPTPEDLIYIVAEEFDVEPEDIYCSSIKDPNVVECRKIVMYLAYRLLGSEGCAKLAHLLNVHRDQFYSDARTIAHRMVADAQLWDKLEKLIKEIGECA